MKKKFGSLCSICLFMEMAFLSSAGAGQESNLSHQFSAELPAPKQRVLPAGATAIPEEELKAAAPITFNELKAFVRDWRKYTRWLKSGGNEYKAVAYLGVSRLSDYPPEVVKWMDEHGWAVDRFFLLERKFRMTLSVQKQEDKQTLLRNHMEQMINQVETNNGLSNDQKQNMKQQYMTTIQSIRAATNVKAPVTPEEYELIKLNHNVLARILAE